MPPQVSPFAFGSDTCRELRRQVMSDLVHVLSGGELPLRLLASRVDVAPETREWAMSLIDRGQPWQFDRYARYLIDGTLSLFGLGEPAGRLRGGGRGRLAPAASDPSAN